MEVYNAANKYLKFRIYAEDGSNEWNEDMSSGIKIYPKSITVQPKSYYKVRIVYSPPKNMVKEKNYKSYIFFKELPVKGEVDLEKNKVVIYNEVGISIYGQKNNCK